MSFFKILKEPFPYDSSNRNHLRISGFFGCFIIVFLILFKPFELDQFGYWKLIWIAFAYGGVTFVCIFLFTTFFQLLFPGYFKESEWTTGKQILLMTVIILLVGFGNYLISPLLVNTQLNSYYALWFQGITLTVAIIPVSIYILIKQNLLLKKYSRQADEIEIKLLEKKNEIEVAKDESVIQECDKIMFTGDYQSESISVLPYELYFIESASNYIKVYHRQNEKLIYTIIRSTLKKTGETLDSYTNFFKCHRSFIVNLDKVMQVKGNAQGYRVKIEDYDVLIPISRNLNNEFSDKLLSAKNKNG